MNDTVKRVLVLADEFALRGYHHGTPDSREAARQALHDELTRLFTPLSDEQIDYWVNSNSSKKSVARAVEKAHGIGGRES